MFGKINKIFSFATVLSILLISLSAIPQKTSADSSVQFTASEDFSNCVGSVDGVQGTGDVYSYYGVETGQTVDLTVLNSGSDSISITIDAPGGDVNQTLPPGSGSSDTSSSNQYTGDFSATEVIKVIATDNNPSCSNSNTAYLYIEDGSGSIACTVSGKNWELNGQFYNVVPEVYLYEGSTFKNKFDSVNNDLTINNYALPAETSSEIFYIYNGTGQSYSQIGSATCPAIAAASNTNGSSTTAKVTPLKTSNQTGPGLSKTSNITYSVLSKKKNNVTGYLIILAAIGGLLVLTYLGSLIFVIKQNGHFSWAALAPGYNTWLALRDTIYKG